MKQLAAVLATVAVGLVGLAFYRGWFHMGSDKTEVKSNVTLSVDTNKFKEDSKKAVAAVEGLGQQITDTVVGAREKSHDGKVVSVNADKLTMTDKDGKEHSHTLIASAKVTCDGKDCTAESLKAGTKIRVTTNSADAAVRIEALDKDTAFVGTHHDGKAVSITTAKIVMTNMEGAAEHAFTLNADSKITCDGKDCKAGDVKPGMRVRITTENADSHVATIIEAIDKNRDFEKGA